MLPGLTSLSDATAEALSHHEHGALLLRGLTSLSETAAESLSQHDGEIWLDSLRVLSDAAAEALSSHRNLVNLHNVPESARAILRKAGHR